MFIQVMAASMCLPPIVDGIHVSVKRGVGTSPACIEIEVWHPDRDAPPDIIPASSTDGVSLGELGHGTVIRARCGDSLFSLAHRIEDDSPRQITLELREVGSVSLTVLQVGPDPAGGRPVWLHSDMLGIQTRRRYSTDASGGLLIEQLPTGVAYRFEIEEGTHSTQIDCRVPSGRRNSVELAVPSLHLIKGVVASRAGPPREPVLVTATLLNSAGNLVSEQEASTLPDGSFSISVYQPGKYVVTVAAPGHYLPRPVKVTVKLDQAIATCRLRLRPSRTLTGTIVDENGQPIRNAWLMIVADPLEDLDEPDILAFQNTLSDARGRFEFNQIRPGVDYLLTANPSGDSEGTSVNMDSIRAGGPALRVVAPSLVAVATGRIECADSSAEEGVTPWRLDVERIGEGGVMRTALTRSVIAEGGGFEILSRVGDPEGITEGDEFVLRLRDANWNTRAARSFRYPGSEPLSMSCDQARPMTLSVQIKRSPKDGRSRAIRLTVYRHLYTPSSFGWEPSNVGFVSEHAAIQGNVELSLSPVDSYWLVAEVARGWIAVHYLSREELLSGSNIQMVLEESSRVALHVHHAPHAAHDDQPVQAVQAVLYRIRNMKPVRVAGLSSPDREFTFGNLRPGVYSLEMAVAGEPRFSIPYNLQVDYCERRRVIVQASGDITVHMSCRR